MRRALSLLYGSLFSVIAMGGTGVSYIKDPSRDSLREKLIQQDYTPFIDDLVDLDFDAFTSMEEANHEKRIILQKNRTQEELIALLLAHYEKTSPLLKTAEDFFEMLSHTDPQKTVVVGKSVDRYLEERQAKFFAASPTVLQIAQLADLCFSDEANIAVRKQGLPRVTSPADFLTLITSVYAGGEYVDSREINRALTKFVHENLTIFEKTNPQLEDVIHVEKYLLKVQVHYAKSEQGPEREEDLNATITALIDLKKAYVDKFSGSQRARLLDSGGKNPNARYLTELDKLRTQAYSNSNNGH